MQKIRKISNLDNPSPLLHFIAADDAAFFDIETTGLSPRSASIYLTGLGIVNGDKYEVTQFFADSPEDEADVLCALFTYLSDQKIKRLISFNGLGFDVPFVNKRCDACGLDYSLDSYEHFDIFKLLSKQKSFLGLSDCRQKTVEAFLGIAREDIYNGGQLIEIYKHYVRTNNDAAFDALVLHNYEDMLGMPALIPALSYCYNLKDNKNTHYLSSHEENNILHISLEFTHEMPKVIKASYEDISFIFSGRQVFAKIPIKDSLIKMYFANYKDYYYVPDEDMAVHKSVAKFMDKTHRQKATPADCYQWVKYDDELFANSSGEVYIRGLVELMNECIKKRKP